MRIPIPIVDYLIYLRKLARTIRTASWRQRSGALRFLALFIFVFPVLFLSARLGFVLDHIFYPRFKDVEIRSPVFIVGSWRTGSTFLHRTLGQDTDHIATLRMIDLFLPSIVQKKAMAAVARLDARLGGHGARALRAVDKAFLPSFSKIHDTGMLKVEEDEFLFLLGFASAALFQLAPNVERFRRFMYFDRELSLAEQDRALRGYKRIVQRYLFHVGTDKLFVSKNPMFTPKMAGLLRAFPDARFVNLVRSPLNSVPSTASLLHFVWHHTGALDPEKQDMDTILELSRYFYDYPLEVFQQLPDDQGVELRYDDLVGDPTASIPETLEALGLSASDDLHAILAAMPKRERRFKSGHKYSLASWGLTEDELHDAFGDVFQRYDFPMRPDVAPEHRAEA